MTTNLTKQELVSKVAEKVGLTKKQASEALDATFETISEELTKGRKFTMTGFGTFSIKPRLPRTGVNPQTGESMVIPGKLVAKFKAGKRLAETLNSIKSISKWVNQ